MVACHEVETVGFVWGLKNYDRLMCSQNTIAQGFGSLGLDDQATMTPDWLKIVKAESAHWHRHRHYATSSRRANVCTNSNSFDILLWYGVVLKHRVLARRPILQLSKFRRNNWSGVHHLNGRKRVR